MNLESQFPKPKTLITGVDYHSTFGDPNYYSSLFLKKTNPY